VIHCKSYNTQLFKFNNTVVTYYIFIYNNYWPCSSRFL